MELSVKRYPAYLGGVRQAYPHIEAGKPFNSRSVVVGNLILLSMVSARSMDSGKVEGKTLKEQVFAALDNIRVAMEEAGSSMNNIIKDTVLVGKREDVAPVRAAMLEYYQQYAPVLVEEPPATSFMVTQLEDPAYMVQIDALGVITRGCPGWETRMIPAHYAGIRQSFPSVRRGDPIFSRASTVGNLIFCHSVSARSLVTGKIEAGSFEEQMQTVMDKVRMNLDQAGGSMNNLIKTCYYFKDIDAHYTTMRKLESLYFQRYTPSLAEDPPASTVCMVDPEDPKCLIEVDAIGVIAREKPAWEMKKYPAYYGGVKYAYPHVPPGSPMFSRSAVAGNLIFCSGATGLALDSFKQTSNAVEDQMLVTMNKIKMYMDQAGSCLENIVKMNIFLKDINDLRAVRKAELDYYILNAPALVGEPPATAVIKSRLHKPETLMEIEAIGVIPSRPTVAVTSTSA
jgi:enamine deaminase RidA (YjgF/YER057c/UK114 family)